MILDLLPVTTDIFSQSDFLHGLSEKYHQDIFNQGDSIKIKAGEELFCQGDPADRCYFVLKGRLKLAKIHEQGKTALIRYINVGELTAAIAVFKGRDYPVTAEAVDATDVVGWNKEAMISLMLEYPQLAVNVLQVAINRIDDLQDRYMELYAEQVEQRIARALLRIMKQSGRKVEEGILIDFRLSRQELAEYAGATIYTVSRVISAWEKKGWIVSGRERITISNPHALVLFAENS